MKAEFHLHVIILLDLDTGLKTVRKIVQRRGKCKLGIRNKQTHAWSSFQIYTVNTYSSFDLHCNTFEYLSFNVVNRNSMV